MTTTTILHGELHDQLVAAMQRVPSSPAGALPRCCGGITNRNFLVTAADADDR